MSAQLLEIKCVSTANLTATNIENDRIKDIVSNHVYDNLNHLESIQVKSAGRWLKMVG